jgi:adenosylcobinamide-GDP ribazoletransferase
VNTINRILTAFRLLTIIPLPGGTKTKFMPDDCAKSMAFFPLVGFVIGIGLFFLGTALSERVSPFTSATILVVFWGWISGALHLEGFIDAVDGFSASFNKDKILAVMKDVHCGAKGVVAIVFLIALKIVLVHDICVEGQWTALMIIPAVGRWAMVCAASMCSYAGETEGLGAMFIKDTGMKEFFFSTAILVLAGCCLLKWKILFLMLLPVVFLIVAIIYLKKKIRGVTGDVLGAINEITEVICLMSALLWKI